MRIRVHFFLSSVIVSLAITNYCLAQNAIVIKGSDTLGAKLIPKIAEAYENKNPGSKFEIAAEGSSTGISAITDGTADIGMSSRDLKSKEKIAAGANGVRLFKTVIAKDAVAVIVNKSNPIAKLSLKDIERIFTGDITNWSALAGKSGSISAYTRNTSSGTYAYFQKFAMAERDYGSDTQKMAGNEQIVIEVASNPNGIGYIGLAYIQARGIKVVAIDGFLPTPENANNGSYKFTRGLNCITNGVPTGSTKKFLDFALSIPGQEIVASTGFVPIK